MSFRRNDRYTSKQDPHQHPLLHVMICHLTEQVYILLHFQHNVYEYYLENNLIPFVVHTPDHYLQEGYCSLMPDPHILYIACTIAQ